MKYTDVQGDQGFDENACALKHIAIVPARAGSVSIANKNLVPLLGKPLINHTLTSACAAHIFDKIILTTDITTLLEETDTPWIRMKRMDDLAMNDTPMIRVVRDVLTRFSVPDHTWIWLLQPTSPFRVREDFNGIAQVTSSHKHIKAVMSTTCVDDRHALRQYFRDTDGEVKRLINKPKLDAFMPRQKLKPAVERNGLFYAMKAKWLREFECFDPHPCYGYEIPEERARNINSPYDYELAQFEAERLRAKGIWPSV